MDSAPAAASPPTALPSGIRTAIYAVGTALFLASLVFVGLSAARNWPAISSTRITSLTWFLASAALYAVSHVSTSLTWPLALQRMGERIALVDGVRIGLVAQIGKYLPGNVAHYVGRGGLARTVGIPLKTSGLSTGVELVSALGAAVIISAIAAAIDPGPLAVLPQLGGNPSLVASAISLAALSFAVWMTSRGHGLLLFAIPIASLTVSLLLSGLSLYALIGALHHAQASVTVVLAAVALAWVAGFVVPGAPAGIGIREAILVAILSGEIGAGAAVTAALLHRLITAAVDVLAAGVGYAWMSRTGFSKK